MDLKTIIEDAWQAGWDLSAEGYNAEFINGPEEDVYAMKSAYVIEAINRLREQK